MKIKKMLCCTFAAAMLFSLVGNAYAAETEDESKDEAVILTIDEIDAKLADLEDSAVGEGEGLKIGFIPSTMVNPYFSAMLEGVETAMEKYPKAELVTFDPSNDITKQTSQIEDMISMGVNALLVVPIDTAGMRTTFQLCHDNGIFVINLDNPVIPDDYDQVDALICSDNIQLGYLAGKDLAERMPDGGNIAVVGLPTAEACVLNVEGFWKGIEENAADPSKFVQVAEADGQGNTETSYSKAVDILEANPDIDAWYCINDPSALGVLAAAQEAGRAGDDMLIYGKDASPDYKALMGTDGLVQSSAQSPIGMGKMGVEYAMQLIGGQSVEFLTHIAAISVTAENVDEYGREGFL